MSSILCSSEVVPARFCGELTNSNGLESLFLWDLNLWRRCSEAMDTLLKKILLKNLLLKKWWAQSFWKLQIWEHLLSSHLHCNSVLDSRALLFGRACSSVTQVPFLFDITISLSFFWKCLGISLHSQSSERSSVRLPSYGHLPFILPSGFSLSFSRLKARGFPYFLCSLIFPPFFFSLTRI